MSVLLRKYSKLVKNPILLFTDYLLDKVHLRLTILEAKNNLYFKLMDYPLTFF